MSSIFAQKKGELSPLNKNSENRKHSSVLLNCYVHSGSFNTKKNYENSHMQYFYYGDDVYCDIS